MNNNARTTGILTIVAGGLGALGFGFGLNAFLLGWLIDLISNAAGYPSRDFPLSLIYGFLAFPAGVMAVILGIYLITRKTWWVAVAGVAASMIAFFPCGIAALVYLVKARPEFAPASQEQLPAGETSTPEKKKSAAVWLAIFFGPFTWLYTYKRDALKAAIGLGVGIPMLFAAGYLPFIFRNMFNQLITLDQSNTPPSTAFYFVFSVSILVFVWFPLWLWAVIDMATASEWDVIKKRPRSKVVAILLGVLLNPWTWFYTYKKDALKFWLFAIISYGVQTLFIIWLSQRSFSYTANTGSFHALNWQYWTLEAVSSVISLSILVTSVLITALRPKEWYDNYQD